MQLAEIVESIFDGLRIFEGLTDKLRRRNDDRPAKRREIDRLVRSGSRPKEKLWGRGRRYGGHDAGVMSLPHTADMVNEDLVAAGVVVDDRGVRCYLGNTGGE